MVVCATYPRFELRAAISDPQRLLSEPVALAPGAGGGPIVVGEASPAAEAHGVRRGMRLGEAFARCPGLRLVPADPEKAQALWADVVERLEGLGAAVEADHPGTAFFETSGLEKIHGGPAGVLAAASGSSDPGVRLAAASSRFAAQVAALHARPGRRMARRFDMIVPPGRTAEFLAPFPSSSLHVRTELEKLPEALDQLGIHTLGELAALPRQMVAERFGHDGLLALELARGHDTPLIPRPPSERIAERLELPEAVSGLQLERGLDLLIARLLASGERRGRSVRALALSAHLVAGGTWRVTVTLRRASADPGVIRLTLAPKLLELPAPAESLALAVEAFGPSAREQQSFLDDDASPSRARLSEAIRQARLAAGSGSVMRVIELDPQSRIPERRTALAPFTEQ